MRKSDFSLLIVLFLFFSSVAAGAEDYGELIDFSQPFSRLLGFTPTEVFDVFGAPAEVYSLRNSEPGFDNVVFFYDSFLYVYLYENRVWQVRVDERHVFDGPFEFGMRKDDFTDVFGDPILENDEELGGIAYHSLIYQWYPGTWPVRLRAVFVEHELMDLYFYRGDF